MEDVNDNAIYKIMNQKYIDTPLVKINLEDINLKNKKILILCGSGLTKDFNIDTFEEMKKNNYYDIFSLSNYENDTLNFYEYINLFKKKCSLLNKININNINNIFVVTTNIDGMFIGNNIFEIHGNIFEYKCLHCNDIKELKMINILPLCTNCNNIVRPNVQLYSDSDFKLNDKQLNQYKEFKKNLSIDNTIIFEIGCGLSVPILRHETEILKEKGFDIYRINVKDFDNNTKSIQLSGKLFIEFLQNNIIHP